MSSTMIPSLGSGHHNHTCPQSNTMCHWHQPTGKECHIPWHSCDVASNAIKAAFHAHSVWTGAPRHWNEWHAQCVHKDAKLSDMCKLHLEIHKASPPSHKG